VVEILETGQPGEIYKIPGTGDRGRVTAADIASWLSERSARHGILTGTGPRELHELSATLENEAVYAAGHSADAVQWYQQSVERAMGLMHKLHPELATDRGQEGLFKALTAITSNGMGVEENLARAHFLYGRWKETGKIETTGTYGGSTAGGINAGLSALQDLIDARGLDGAREFLLAPMTVRELGKLGFSVSGEKADAVVRGANILGPKIGSFYGNLQGDWSTITMDRWFMRTFNRMRGTLVGASPTALKGQAARLRDYFASLPDGATAGSLHGHSRRLLMDQAERMAAGADPAVAPDLLDWAKKQNASYAAGSFRDRSEANKAAKNLFEEIHGMKESPASASEREWIRKVMGETQRRLAARGLHYSNAALQALLWYHEKRLWRKLGYSAPRAREADYASAAQKLLAREGVKA
jgi:hypothetical protein